MTEWPATEVPRLIRVPTVNDEIRDFNALFSMWEDVSNSGKSISLDFTGCTFLKQNAVAFLGGLTRWMQHRGFQVEFMWPTLPRIVQQHLSRSGFMSAHAGLPPTQGGHSIPYREDLIKAPDSLATYLKEHWLGHGWVHVSHRLRDAIVGKMWEIYDNAFEHGQSPIGIYSCGQHFPKRQELKLSVVDFGVGIPGNVRAFTGIHTMSAATALEWAFRRGNTTKPIGTARGLGLDLLRNFITANGGHLELFSHDGCARILPGEVRFEPMKSSFAGTLINVTLVCDEAYYKLASEDAEGPLF